MNPNEPTTPPTPPPDDDTQRVPIVAAPSGRRPIGSGRAAHAHLSPGLVLGGVGAALALVVLVALLVRGGGENGRSPEPAPAQSATQSATPESPTVVAQLVDRSGEIALSSNGEVSGLDGVSLNVRRRVAETLAQGRLPASPEMDALGGVAGGLGAAGLEPLAPIGVLVSDERPLLRWRREEGAPPRVVAEILDASGVVLTESPTLSGNEWRPPRAIPRGRTLLWRLRYRNEEREWAVVPRAPFGGVRFAVLRVEELAWREREVKASRDSLLVQAVLSVQLGVLEEARTALLELARRNPGEPLVGRLLTDLEHRNLPLGP